MTSEAELVSHILTSLRLPSTEHLPTKRRQLRCTNCREEPLPFESCHSSCDVSWPALHADSSIELRWQSERRQPFVKPLIKCHGLLVAASFCVFETTVRTCSCPACHSTINIGSTRCPYCATQLTRAAIPINGWATRATRGLVGLAGGAFTGAVGGLVFSAVTGWNWLTYACIIVSALSSGHGRWQVGPTATLAKRR